MSLANNLIVAVGFVLVIYIMGQLLHLAKRLYNSDISDHAGLDDRQNNAYNVEEQPYNRYGDIFYIEPTSEDAARIREQLEKDEKDLPSYDEVMRICNLTAASESNPTSIQEPLTIAALPAPPYSEVDPNATSSTMTAPEVVVSSGSIIDNEPSTSRAVQASTSSSVVTSISHTVSTTVV